MDGSLLSNESSWNCSHAVSVRPGPGIPDLRIDQTGFTWPRRDPTWTAVVKSDLMRSKMTFQCLKMSEKTNDRGDTVKCKSPGANNSYFKSFLIKYILREFTVSLQCVVFAIKYMTTVRCSRTGVARLSGLRTVTFGSSLTITHILIPFIPYLKPFWSLRQCILTGWDLNS